MKTNNLFVFLLISLSSGFYSCALSVSSASIEEVKLCERPRQGALLCNQDMPKFTQGAPNLYVSCVLKYAPEDTQITFSWYYTSGERQLIDDVTLRAGDFGSGSTYNLGSHLTSPNSGWPKGNYEVVISLDTDNAAPTTKPFSI